MLEIRTMKKEDVEQIVPGFIKAFNEGEWGQRWSEDSAKRSLNNLTSFPDFYGLVAMKEGKAAGAILGHVQTFNDGKTYYIDELFVAPEFQKRGIAKKLYQKAIEELKEMGVSGSFFTTLRNSTAYQFYLSQGAIDLKDSAVFYHPF